MLPWKSMYVRHLSSVAFIPKSSLLHNWTVLRSHLGLGRFQETRQGLISQNSRKFVQFVKLERPWQLCYLTSTRHGWHHVYSRHPENCSLNRNLVIVNLKGKIAKSEISFINVLVQWAIHRGGCPRGNGAELLLQMFIWFFSLFIIYLVLISIMSSQTPTLIYKTTPCTAAGPLLYYWTVKKSLAFFLFIVTVTWPSWEERKTQWQCQEIYWVTDHHQRLPLIMVRTTAK